MFIINKMNVEASLNMNSAINVIENALEEYASGSYIQPPRISSQVKDENNLLIMSCVVDHCIGLKVVTSYPSNSVSNTFPVTQGVIMINDVETGEPLSLIDGTLLTAIKTGAVSGVAMKYLKKDAKTIGLVGTGLQGIYQLIAALVITSVKTIYLYNRTPGKLNNFINKLNEMTDKKVYTIPVFDTEELVKKSDIIITATTSFSPVLPDKNIYNNKLIIAVGSYKENMRELPETVFRTAEKLYVDSLEGKKESGDIIDPLKNKWIREKNLIALSEITTGGIDPPTGSKPVIFKNINMALFDTMIGNYVYKTAFRNGHGLEVEF